MCPDQTTTFESRPTETSMEPSQDQPKSCTSLSCPMSLRKIRQFSTFGVSLDPMVQVSTHSRPFPCCVHTEAGIVRRRIWVMYVDAHNLVVSPRGQKLAPWRKSDGVYGPRVVAHRGQLLRLVVGSVGCVVYRFGGPYSNMSICTRRSVFFSACHIFTICSTYHLRP